MAFLTRLAITAGAAVILGTTLVQAAPRVSVDEVLGPWLTQKEGVVIELRECQSEDAPALCGRIVWLRKPYTDDGDLKRDPDNPDPSLRDRPLCGIDVITGLQRNDEDTWIYGRVYNPKNGKDYRAYLTARDDGTLHIRAYVGVPLFGKSEEWTRPQGIDIGCPES